jgi:hypothetical protein
VTELETDFVEPRFSYLIHNAIFEACTLRGDPIGQFRVFLVPSWHIDCNAGRAKGGVLVGGSQDEDKTVDSPTQLTVTMYAIIVAQLLELQIPFFVLRLVVSRFESETNFVEPPFSYMVHFAIFEACTLRADPIGQFRVFLVPSWHIACNPKKRAVGGVLVGVLFR